MTAAQAQTVRQALAWAATQIDASFLPDTGDARTDAEYLLMHVLHCSRSRLITEADMLLSPAQWQAFQAQVVRRQAGEPVAYITGTRGFWTLDLRVTPDVLIPRPETELLVESVLAMADNNTALTVVDLGTGSGAIALAIASERPNWRVMATDASAAALQVARLNAKLSKLADVEFLQGNWCDALPAGLSPDIIVSNPPYIAPDDPHLQQGDLRFEPRSALSAGDDGLKDIRHITTEAGKLLHAGGVLLLEHGYRQAQAVRDIMIAAGFEQVKSLRDLGGHERVTQGVRR